MHTTTMHHKKFNWPIVRKAQLSYREKNPEWFEEHVEKKGLSLLSGELAEEYARIHATDTIPE